MHHDHMATKDKTLALCIGWVLKHLTKFENEE